MVVSNLCQVCVLSLTPEPNLVCCNSVCNARILSIAAVPNKTETGHETSLRPSPTSNAPSPSISAGGETRTSAANDDLTSSSTSSDEDEDEEGGLNLVSDFDALASMEPPPALYGSSEAAAADLSPNVAAAEPDQGENTECEATTMWLGTEDGHVHVYNCGDNVRLKKNRDKFVHTSPVLAIA